MTKTLANKITELITSNFEPTAKIEVFSPRNDDKHFAINIKSIKFKGQTRIYNNRLVYEILTPLFESQELHAVTLNLSYE